MEKQLLKGFIVSTFFAGIMYLLISIHEKTFNCLQWQINTFDYFMISTLVMCFYIVPILYFLTDGNN